MKEKVNKGTDLILEVGSGSGRHISVLSEAGYFAIGVDLDEKYMSAGKASGLDLRCGTLETVELPKAPKVIFYHHVFEHIADAKSELDRAWRRLENGGYLVIAVPGIRYYGKVYGRDFIKYLQIAHTQNYSLHTLSVLLASEGFQLVHGNETVRAIYQKVAKTETTQKSNSKNSAWGLAERESVLWHIRNEEQLFSEGKVETKGRNKRSKSSVSRSVMKLKRLLQGL